MKRASVSEAKNGLSGLLSEVRRGEAVLITHRGRPVARIEPCHVEGPGAEHAMAEILQRGVAVPPRAPLDVDRFLGVPVARLTEGARASEVIVADRRARD
jgi:prevent-host-death family protein